MLGIVWNWRRKSEVNSKLLFPLVELLPHNYTDLLRIHDGSVWAFDNISHGCSYLHTLRDHKAHLIHLDVVVGGQLTEMGLGALHITPEFLIFLL